jgi:hypothetical protein
MKQHTCSPSLNVAGIALALFGLCAVLGLGSMGEAQAGQQALFQSFAQADRVGTGDYVTTRVSRSPGDKKCPRSADGCDTKPSCPPDATVCPKPS